MRVIFNFTPSVPNQPSGVSVYAWRMLHALVLAGEHDYVLATNWDEDRLPPFIRALRVPLVRVKVPRNELLGALNRHLQFATRRDLVGDIIFTPNPMGPLFGSAARVIVLHDLYRVTHPHLYPRSRVLSWNFTVPPIVRRAHAIVAVSAATRDAAALAYPSAAERLHVIHEASPLSDALEDARLPLGLPQRFGLVVANVTPNKNIRQLISAMQILNTRDEPIDIVLVGADETGDLDRLPEGISIHRVSGLSDDVMKELYASAHFYVNTSLIEGFCLPLLEAQTFGAPIICSDIPVLREVAGDGAIFVEPGDAEALAREMSSLLQDERRRSDLQQKGSENVRRFSWAKAASEMGALFSKVAEASSAQRI